jgi:hypothetical protein
MMARVPIVPAIGISSPATIPNRGKARRRRSPGRKGRERSMPTINRGTANQARAAALLFSNHNSGEPS